VPTPTEKEEDEAKLVALKAAIAEGRAGPFTDADVVFARLEQRIKDRAAAKGGTLDHQE
jgi:hypothetical protein